MAKDSDSDEKAIEEVDAPISDTPELDEQAESICRWGAARAAAIVVIPIIGLLWLTGNIMYMVARIAKIYGVNLSKASITGFISSMIGSGILMYLCSPIPGLNIGIAAAVTYGIGKAAQAWIKDGMPADVAKYKEEYEAAKKKAKGLKKEFKSDPRRKKSLGRKA
jgi:uncharacterized protein (DUF697 family)